MHSTVVVHSVRELEEGDWGQWRIATTRLNLVHFSYLSLLDLAADSGHTGVESPVECTEKRSVLSLCLIIARSDRADVSCNWFLAEHGSASLERFHDIVLVCVRWSCYQDSINLTVAKDYLWY